MVKLVDTRDLKSLGDLAVPVQVRLGPPNSSFPSLRKSQQKIPCLQGFRVVRLFYLLRKSTKIYANNTKFFRGLFRGQKNKT